MGTEFTRLLDGLGWTILHSLWQVGLAFICVVGIRAVLRGRSPALQYMLQMGVLFACSLAFLITFGLYFNGSYAGVAANIAAQDMGSAALSGGRLPFGSGTPVAGFMWPDFSGLTPLIAIGWSIGFIALSLRYAFAYGQVQQLRILGVSDAPLEWKIRFLELLERSNVAQHVQLRISQHIDGPMTMGYFKPVVLVPVGFLSGLPADQVEAVLLHELAHIRRHDYAFNLFQTAVKTVLFYHPAIHIISRWIDRDREQACDDLAVARGQNPAALVRGLAALRLQNNQLVMAATGRGEEAPMLARLSRLMGQTPRNSKRPEHVVMSLLSVLVIGAVYVAATAQAEAHPPSPSLPIAEPVAPMPPVLNDTIITAPATLPAPPAPPIFSPLDASIAVDEAVFSQVLARDMAVWSGFSRDMAHYSRALERHAKTSDMHEDEYEALVDLYENTAESAEEIFEDRRDTLEDRFEDYVEREHKMSDQAIRVIEQNAERLAESIERQVEVSVERSVRQLEHQVHKEAEKAARKAEAMARKSEQKYKAKDEAQQARYESFRDSLMQALLADGLINSMDETVKLSHPKNTMTLNGQPMPSQLRGKYCDMWDSHGFIDGRTEIVIKPESFTILKDYRDRQHRTRVTYGAF